MRADRLIAFAGTLAAANPAAAAGFAVSEQGAAALGVGGAATARLDLPEAVFFDPAAIARHEGLRAAAGVALVAPSMSHLGEDGTRTDALSGFETPPYLHLSYGAGTFAAGVSVGVPYGASLAWPEEGFEGRFEVTRIALQVFEVAPVLAVRPVPELSFAAGPRILRSTVELSRKLDAVDSEGAVTLGGAATGVGGQAAIAYGPVAGFTFGLAYRSRAHLAYEGSAHFEDVPPELSGKAHDGAVTTELTLPDRLAAGVAYELPDAIASLDVEWTAWSTFETFAIDFADEATPDVDQPRRWEDTLAVRAGYEQRGLVDGLALRAGAAWDPTPSPSDTLSPTLPDQDRVLLTLGAGYEAGGGVTVDAAFGHVFLLGAEAEGPEALPGSYEGRAEVLTVGVTYRR